MRLRAAQLVLVVIEVAGEQERVERKAVSRRHDVSAGDVGAGGRAGAGEQGQQPRMVGGEDRQLGDGREGVGRVSLATCGLRARRCAANLACSTAFSRRSQPVVGVVAIDIALDLGLRPVGEVCAECRLRGLDPVARADLRVAAGNDRLGLVVERAQELALPAVPDAGPDSADVGNGEHQQQLQTLGALHDVGEVADGLGIADVAAGAILLIVRCCSISQATVSVSAGVRPKRGHSSRAMRAPTIE